MTKFPASMIYTSFMSGKSPFSKDIYGVRLNHPSDPFRYCAEQQLSGNGMLSGIDDTGNICLSNPYRNNVVVRYEQWGKHVRRRIILPKDETGLFYPNGVISGTEFFMENFDHDNHFFGGSFCAEWFPVNPPKLKSESYHVTVLFENTNLLTFYSVQKRKYTFQREYFPENTIPFVFRKEAAESCDEKQGEKLCEETFIHLTDAIHYLRQLQDELHPDEVLELIRWSATDAVKYAIDSYGYSGVILVVQEQSHTDLYPVMTSVESDIVKEYFDADLKRFIEINQNELKDIIEQTAEILSHIHVPDGDCPVSFHFCYNSSDFLAAEGTVKQLGTKDAYDYIHQFISPDGNLKIFTDLHPIQAGVLLHEQNIYCFPLMQ